MRDAITRADGEAGISTPPPLDSGFDAPDFGGSGYGAHGAVIPDPAPLHGQPRSLTLRLPPLAAVVYRPDAG